MNIFSTQHRRMPREKILSLWARDALAGALLVLFMAAVVIGLPVIAPHGLANVVGRSATSAAERQSP